MKIITNFMGNFMETFQPYLKEIEDARIRDVARVALPLSAMLFYAFMLSLPFTLAAQIINALVQLAKV